uniref:PBPe domain-containing protein n=1 Tax=Caenorhabditis tropicalis TaxID=1561998 RepID=A0A1I7TCM6_9PELO
MDKNDSFAKSAVRHLNISKMFFNDKFRVDTISLDRFDFNETADINSLCVKMVNVSFVISVCRSSHSIGIVAELARISQVPTIQVDLNYWSLPLNFNGQHKNLFHNHVQAADYIDQRVFNMYVLTKDITAFKCDSCESALMFWMRPFPVGKIMEIRDLDDYLFRNEIGLELDYSINGWDSLNVAFYMNVMGYAFETIREMNATFDVLPTFTCEAGPSEPNITTTVREVVLNDPAHEYGNYTESSPNLFFQNLEVRIYKIDRDRDHEDALFNKEVGVWTPTSKLSVMYGTLQVDVRNLNIFRVVTLIQPPFVQRTGDPNTPYEGYCIDLINMIQVEVNFTYTIYEVEDGSFGTMDDNGNWNGLIGALVSGSADIALAPLSVMAERENDVDFTVPYYDLVGTTILMKKADVEYSLFKFMKVLEWPVWLCIVAAYLFTSILLWIFDRFSPYSFTNNKESMWKEMSLNESMSPRDRAKLAVWDYPVSDKFTNMWRYMQESKLPPDMDAAVDRVLNSVDGFAFIGDATEIKYAALTNCKLQQVGTEFSRKPYAIAVQSGHILKDKISSAILMLLNQRRLETLKEKWWTDNPNKVNCPDSSDESDGISIQNIGGVFIVILAGIALSIVTLAFEYYYYKRKARKAAEKEKEQIEMKIQQVIPNGVHQNGIKQDGPKTVNGTNGNGNAVQRTKRSNSVSAYENTAFQY